MVTFSNILQGETKIRTKMQDVTAFLYVDAKIDNYIFLTYKKEQKKQKTLDAVCFSRVDYYKSFIHFKNQFKRKKEKNAQLILYQKHSIFIR